MAEFKIGDWVKLKRGLDNVPPMIVLSEPEAMNSTGHIVKDTTWVWVSWLDRAGAHQQAEFPTKVLELA